MVMKILRLDLSSIESSYNISMCSLADSYSCAKKESFHELVAATRPQRVNQLILSYALAVVIIRAIKSALCVIGRVLT